MRRAFAAGIGIFILAPISLAQNHTRVQPDKISTDPFVLSLRKVAAAAEERTPFASITISGSTLKPTAPVLEGASSCVIGMRSGNDVPASAPFYACTWKVSDTSHADTTYEQLVGKILRSGDWIATSFQGVPSLKDAAFDTSIGICTRLNISRPEKQVVRVFVAAACPKAIRSATTAGSSTPAQARTQARPGQAAAPTATQSKTASQQMSMGILAVVSDHEGALFVDGDQKTALVPDKVVTLNLTAGQHFVDLRDAKGSKLWEKVVLIPVGAQTAERILGIPATASEGTVINRTNPTGPFTGPSTAPQSGVEPSSQQSRAFISSGEWTCVAPCAPGAVSVGVSVSGSEFSATIEVHPELKGQSCNPLDTLPPSARASYWCYFNAEYHGIIEGSMIEGEDTMKNNHSDFPGCDPPIETHRFTGMIKENGQLIALTSDANEFTYAERNTNPWRWQKPKIVCEGATVSSVKSGTFILRSKAPNGPSMQLVPMAPNPTAYSPNSYIGSQIDEVIKSGRYTALPTAQPISGTNGQQPGLSIENQTPYELTILMTGPVERSFTIPAGSSQVVVVPPGAYRVVGKVNAPNVLPFFGTQGYTTGTSYRESFYIK